MYENGWGVQKDFVEAVKWYRKAADQGNAAGQRRLGNVYVSGRGVPEDFVEAMKWYRKAADQNDAGAQSMLGLRYEEGLSESREYEEWMRDRIEAVKWHRLAADQGNDYSQYRLGLMCREKYIDQALMWFDLSASQGNKHAEMERDQLLGKMTQDQLKGEYVKIILARLAAERRTAVVGKDPNMVSGLPPKMVIGMAVVSAREVIEEQIEAYEKSNGTTKPKIRGAIDDFVVGYALGMAISTIKLNGGSPEVSAYLEERIQNQLESGLPNINVSKAIREKNVQFKCGFFIGSVEGERTGRYEALRHVLGLLSPYQLAPATYFQQNMDKNLGLSRTEFDLVGEAAQQIAKQAGNPNA